MTKNLRIIRLGLQHYEKVWKMQRAYQRALIEGSIDPTLILCEHFPVITLGRSTKPGNIFLNKEALSQRGIEFFEVERGGDVTYHGPGQIVGYPIVNLNFLKRDVGWYMRSLEQVIIETLQAVNIDSRRVQGRTGVWTEHPDDGTFNPQRKIASIGVRISRWCTMHGFSLNVSDSAVADPIGGFSLINPCGFTDIKMTSVSAEQTRSDLARGESTNKISHTDLLNSILEILEKKFCEVFGFSSIYVDQLPVDLL